MCSFASIVSNGNIDWRGGKLYTMMVYDTQYGGRTKWPNLIVCDTFLVFRRTFSVCFEHCAVKAAWRRTFIFIMSNPRRRRVYVRKEPRSCNIITIRRSSVRDLCKVFI